MFDIYEEWHALSLESLLDVLLEVQNCLTPIGLWLNIHSMIKSGLVEYDKEDNLYYINETAL